MNSTSFMCKNMFYLKLQVQDIPVTTGGCFLLSFVLIANCLNLMLQYDYVTSNHIMCDRSSIFKPYKSPMSKLTNSITHLIRYLYNKLILVKNLR